MQSFHLNPLHCTTTISFRICYISLHDIDYFCFLFNFQTLIYRQFIHIIMRLFLTTGFMWNMYFIKNSRLESSFHMWINHLYTGIYSKFWFLSTRQLPTATGEFEWSFDLVTGLSTNTCFLFWLWFSNDLIHFSSYY